MFYYDRQGNRITRYEWAAIYSDSAYRIIRQEKIGHPRTKWLSTVWLGLDHSYLLNEPKRPVIFETMLFNKGKWLELGMWRYSTEEDARTGHMILSERYRYNRKQRRRRHPRKE